MDAQRWRRIRELFDRASELAPSQWEDALRAACPDDAALRADVLDLLRADADATDRTEMLAQAPDVVAGLAEQLDAASSAAYEGLVLGPFRLVREIGRGGMGAVWLAERIDGQFAQVVAIKLVRGGWDTAETQARFRAERQILASLQHPNIAHLVDGGVSADGWPWLALEYVDGVDLRAWCDAQRLDLRARLALFLTVCEAVQHAHQRLVVHRDLKPSNILVSRDGVVKLLDFGIAKLIAEDAAATSATRIFTPEYAAPEQVRGEVVTTAVDIYALGLLLYELLSGQRPYQVDNSTPAAYERAILDQEPTRPSLAVTRDPARAGELAARRHLTPERLRRELRGDLDAIVLKALRKEPALRYANASELAADVQRHLDRRPVLARRGGWRYRAARFVRRHALAVGLAGLLVVALVAGLALTLYQAQTVRREAQKSRQVLDFMVGVFTSADTGKTSGKAITAVELLDQARERIRSEVQDPAPRSELLLAMTRAYRGVSNAVDTLPLTDEAVSLRRGMNDPQLLARALALRSASQQDLGKHDDALKSLDEAAALALGRGADADKTRIEVQSRRANALMSLGRVVEAEQAFGDAYARRRQLLGDDDPITQETGIRWVRALLNTDQFARGREAVQPIVDTLRRGGAERATELAGALDALGAGWRHDDPWQHLRYSREALEQERVAYGDTSTHTALRMGNLADQLTEVGEYAEALQWADKALALRRAHAAENPGSIYQPLVTLATVHLRRGDAVTALPLLDEAIALRDKGQPKPPLSVAWAIALRGHARYRLNRNDDGRADFDRAALGFEVMPAGTWRTASLAIERTVAELPVTPGYDCAAIAAAARDVEQDLGPKPLLAQFSRAAAAACRLRAGDAAAQAVLLEMQTALRARLPADDARLRWIDSFSGMDK
ncbi:MAG TPA: serine/threonine-protein kinase [Tahibacter sp.]|uniref:serine/threonine-protein kinase n=1 Tax=Tahibacter sp. TaxID=2056211 RepID=UPI002B64EDD1|nr:serine/threonine-protein kinase [Tahibacter sp.]HSX62345.1 serine/threonine-protein kinase [Tahibacter sp.]